ncbi:hypothetical protein F5144DRAFT_638983 [Chaetomium tenue]|uniref:Uncharacterized protein n=1 Tax=Chaetomium tenue TaxID=1854479 RepID=A0ACB7PRV8_9PEZI|nr:hypothetical protein F5144DRAFT_638983 [Chaetomium globosum]
MEEQTQGSKRASPEHRGGQDALEHVTKEFHVDLSRRYQKHKVEMETLWRSFDTAQRTNCLTTPPFSALDFETLNIIGHTVIPEWNLRDMVEPGSDYTLDLLKDRATTSLSEQYLGNDDVVFQAISAAGYGSIIIPSPPAREKPVRCQAPPIEKGPVRSSLADLLVKAEERKQNVEDGLRRMCTEPHVLTGAVYTHFYLRPELIRCKGDTKLGDEQTDRYISGSFLQVIHGAVEEIVNWDYIYRLLKSLNDKSKDEAYRAIISQELSNVCHHEYNRARDNFKRIFQRVTGGQLFSRQFGMLDKAGNALVTMKRNLNLVKVAEKDPYLHCLMYLCLQQMTCTEAMDWLKKLAIMYEASPTVMKRLTEREENALGEFMAVIALVDGITGRLGALPPISRKTKKLAKNALQALDQFIVDKVGGKMGFLYEDLIQECIVSLHDQYERVKANNDKQDKIQNMEETPEAA